MPIVQVDCLAVGAPDKHGMVGLIYRVDGFPYDILVSALSGNFKDNIYWLFFQN